MPPKEKELPELYVGQPDGTKVKLGKIQTAEIIAEDCNDILGMETVTFPTQTATFEVTWHPTVDLIYLIIYGRMPTNNWRKMHGYGPRRKSRNSCHKQRKQ